MARPEDILAIVELAVNAEIADLNQHLASAHLPANLVLRILLTYLPESTDPGLYIPLLKGLATDSTNDGTQLPLAGDDDQALQRARRLRLLPLAPRNSSIDPRADSLTLFLVHRAHRIDASVGSLDVVANLLEPFVNRSPFLKTWMVSTLLPLLRVTYDYYPNSNSIASLLEAEELQRSAGVHAWLARAETKDKSKVDIPRALRGLVAPWIYGQTKRTTGQGVVPEWGFVREWIADKSWQDFQQAAEAFLQWNGPIDVDYGEWGEDIPVEEDSELVDQYAQTGLAILYTDSNASSETFNLSGQILSKVANLAGLTEPPDFRTLEAPLEQGVPAQFWESANPADLIHNKHLSLQNQFTKPSRTSLQLANLILSSAHKLSQFGCEQSCRDIARMILSDRDDDQKTELRKILQSLKNKRSSEEIWASSRQHLLWLRNWQTSSTTPEGVFGKIDRQTFENDILHAMLETGRYDLAARIYCTQSSPLPLDLVKETVLSTALASYDAASNGNRTRGGVRKTSDIIDHFGKYFPTSQRFSQINALLAATHSMSFYSLTLERGVPFLPVNIRAHRDPMALIGKILEQNDRSFTKLDDLLEIGRNLVSAGLISTDQDIAQEQIVASRRVTRMAIEAALAANDFDTAYSYVMTRLSLKADESTAAKSIEDGVTERYDDISWRAAFAAGQYPVQFSRHADSRPIEQRMELLSHALLLAPPSALTELLSVWQEREKEYLELKAREAEEDKEADERARQAVPGGFGQEFDRPQGRQHHGAIALQEEAPIGLFDVARGAAAAFSKNAAAMRSGSTPGSGLSEGGAIDDGGDGEGHRIRKRDMVSNMVTGGLVSGIGWVLGAPPVRQE